MGFITTINHRGKEVYSCEIGAEGCRDFPCRAHRCPHGYCQRYYICANCWGKPEVKARFTKDSHKSCGENVAHTRRCREEMFTKSLKIPLRQWGVSGHDDGTIKELWAVDNGSTNFEHFYGMCDVVGSVWMEIDDLQFLKALGHTFTFTDCTAPIIWTPQDCTARIAEAKRKIEAYHNPPPSPLKKASPGDFVYLKAGYKPTTLTLVSLKPLRARDDNGMIYRIPRKGIDHITPGKAVAI